MTTIIGLQEDNGCSMWAESQTTNGERPYFHRDLEKIVSRGQYFLAGAGSARAVDIAHWLWVPPACHVEDDVFLYEFMIITFIPSLRRALVFNGFDTAQSNDEDFGMLVALRGNLFEIASDFSVLARRDGIYGIGTGAAYAIGALSVMATPQEAMHIAIQNDIYSGGVVQSVFQEKT